MSRFLLAVLGWIAVLFGARAAAADAPPQFTRHVEAVFSRLGCNGGTCHGAVRGQGGFRLSLFSADPILDHERLLREFTGRRLDRLDPEASLLLLKATAQVPHGGGKRLDRTSPNHEILRRWIAAGAAIESPDSARVTRLTVTPAEQTIKPGGSYRLRVEAAFADGTTEDVTGLCSFESQDKNVATVDLDGLVQTHGVGDTTLLVRYRAQPAVALVLVPRASGDPPPSDVVPVNFIDRHILAKLKRMNLPPAGLADDATFLRRASLDVTGELPSPAEVRAFLADKDPARRAKKIDELLSRPGYAALWTLKFCDLLKASDFGVYADGITEANDAPRFQHWVRARLEENLPYDQFAERILTATSREGRRVDEWSSAVVAIEEGFKTPRTDLELYSKRKTLDLYWQRRGATGVSGALQVAHAFLGLRLECAQCHRHPHDVWQQDDLLSFANFFMRVRKIGFQGDNEKKFAEVAGHVKGLNEEAKKLAEKVKEMKAGGKLEGDELRTVNEMERRSKMLPEIGKRLLHAEIHHVADGKDAFASVTSPLGTQSSKQVRVLGESKALDLAPDEDPRQALAAWLRRPDNPFFARAIVNRIWAHYFGRGIVDPPDHLSPFNPPSHPELLKELSEQFVKNGYDLKWLHRAILTSRTYQQSSQPETASAVDRANYAYFYYRRLPAEVLVDALNRATGTTEDMDMKYYHWLPDLKTVEMPYTPRNGFVVFMMEQFGRPARNSSSQCDCERDPGASVLQVLSLANHPRVWQKIADPKGQAARIVKDLSNEDARVEEVFLATLSRLPSAPERQACRKYLQESESPEKGVQGIMWSLLNTREFLLQH